MRLRRSQLPSAAPRLPAPAAPPPRERLWRSLRRALLAYALVMLAAFLFSWWQVRAEKAQAKERAVQLREERKLQTVSALQSMEPEALQQVFASDEAVPAAPYFAALVAGDNQEGVGEGYRFPLATKLLQPGLLQTEGTPVLSGKWMTQTIAVVGDDDVSRKWLQLHLERLQSLKTTVVVVSAKTEASFKELQKQMDGLPIVPDTGIWLQTRLVAARAPVYPLFIGLDGKARQLIFSEGFAGGARP